MSRKKKNDFWDGVDDEQVVSYDPPEDEEGEAETEEDWSLLKSTPLKVVMRIILMISCLVALLSGYVAYQYVQDRYAGGSYSSDFFDSESFADQYNNSVKQLISLIGAMEKDSEVTKEGNEELLTTMVENYMGKETNFSFLIQDQDHYAIASSGDDAKDRIEASSHYALITDTASDVSVKSSLVESLLNKDAWTQELSAYSGKYIIYTAVDDQLTYHDAYYNAQQSFEKMGEYFAVAKIVGIAALVIFIICLIFCIMATGQRRGYEGIYLSWFDRVFSELALLIMIAVAGVLIYAIRHFLALSGTTNRIISAALVIAAYGWITRSYFSIVRRIKAGRLFRCSIVGTIVRGVGASFGKLPYPLNAIFEGLLLIIVNGGVVYMVIRGRSYTFHGVKVFYVLAAAAAVIEFVGLLSYATGGMTPYEDQDEEPDEEEEHSAIEELSADVEADREKAATDDVQKAEPAAPASDTEYEEEQDWENMDLSKVIASAEKEKKKDDRIYSSDDAAIEKARRAHAAERKTQVLSEDEIQNALRASGLDPAARSAVSEPELIKPAEKAEAAAGAAAAAMAAGQGAKEMAEEPEDSGRVNFVQLNKEVRKNYRSRLKSRGIIVTMRAPEKPVIIDIDKSSLSILISNIFDQIERLSADNVKTYLETYVQDGKVVYIAKINIADDKKQAAEAAVSDGSFDAARKIVEANDGRFVISIEKSVMRVGMLIDAA